MPSPLKQAELRRVDSKASSSNASFQTSSSSRGLLFGEVPSSPPSSAGSGSFPTTAIRECSVILCASPAFTKFWYSGHIRDYLINSIDDKKTLAALRLVCHDFKTKCAAALFEDITVTLGAQKFLKRQRLLALDRVGHHIKTLHFSAPLTRGGFLPPLIDPVTGDQRSFTYTPQVNTTQQASYNTSPVKSIAKEMFGDGHTHDLLIQQYPPEFHAAVNVDSFIRIFKAMPNIRHLKISCPGQDPMFTSSRRTVSDYALISLRMAVERSQLLGLETLSLLDVHWTALQDLQPVLALGSSPQSARKWAQITALNMELIAPHWNNVHSNEHIKALHSYIRSFSKHLNRFSFRWLQDKGPCPFVSAWETVEEEIEVQTAEQNMHPAVRQYFTGLSHPAHFRSASADSTGSVESTGTRRPRSLHFPCLTYMALDNATVDASQIASFITRHRHTVEDFLLENIAFRTGDWDEALKPLERIARRRERSRRRHDQATHHPQQRPTRPRDLHHPPRDQVVSNTSMFIPIFISPSVLEVPAMPNLAAKPYVEPRIMETLEPQPEPKEPGMFSHAFHRLFDRHGRSEKHIEYAPAPIRAYHMQETKPEPVGKFKQLLRGNFLPWHH